MHIRHIRDRLLIASLILIVPFAIWNISLQVARLRENLAEAMSAQQERASRVADSYLTYVYSMVDLHQSIGLAVGDRRRISSEEANTYLARINRRTPGMMHVAATDANGVVFASSMEELIGYDASAHPSMRRIAEGAGWTITDVFSPQLMGQPVFAIVSGIRDSNNTLRGMVISMADERTLKQIIVHETMQGSDVVLTDSRGAVALVYGEASLSPEHRDWHQQPLIRDALGGKPCIIYNFRMPDGRTMIGAASPVREIGWVAAVFTPRDQVMGPIRNRAIESTFVVVLLSTLTVAAAVYLGNRLSWPMLDLARTARRLGNGDLDARANITTGDEIEFLGNSFNTMAEALQYRTRQLGQALDTMREEAERSEMLYTVSQGLVVTLSLQERLEVIARALSSLCGVSRCTIFLKKGTRLVAAATWGEPSPESILGIALDIPEDIQHELKKITGPIHIADPSQDPFIGPEAAGHMALNAYMLLPLVRTHHLVGLAVLDAAAEHPRAGSRMADTVQGLSGLAAIAIENSETFEKWLKIAQALQRSLLPDSPDRIGDFTFACRYYPAVEIAELGGDFYDFIDLPDGRLGIVIADVSGKGLEAAVYTAMGKYTLRAFISEGNSPNYALSRTNSALLQDSSDWGFVTIFYGILDPHSGHLIYVNGGHPPAVLVRSNGDIELLPGDHRQPPVGIIPGIDYEQHELHLQPGDLLICYTDGVIEARKNGDSFEIERLSELVRDHRHLSPSEIAEVIHEAVAEFSMGRIQDDIALLIAKYEP